MLAVGTFIGAIQGIWIAVLRVPSFVVTLAGLLIWLGVQLWRAPAPDLAPLAPGHRGQAAGTLLRQGFLAAARCYELRVSLNEVRAGSEVTRTDTIENGLVDLVGEIGLVRDGFHYLNSEF